MNMPKTSPVGATEPSTGACPCVNGMSPSSPCREAHQDLKILIRDPAASQHAYGALCFVLMSVLFHCGRT